jgi:predicted metalloprotease with PDZ domain
VGRRQGRQGSERSRSGNQQLWGTVPYEHFYFFNIIVRPANGLEHKSSATLNIPRESMQTRAGYLDWLGLASHEYFHAWNVKRLRRWSLVRSTTRTRCTRGALWFVEGVSDYYKDLQVHRAGISTREEYFAMLSDA